VLCSREDAYSHLLRAALVVSDCHHIRQRKWDNLGILKKSKIDAKALFEDMKEGAKAHVQILQKALGVPSTPDDKLEGITIPNLPMSAERAIQQIIEENNPLLAKRQLALEGYAQRKSRIAQSKELRQTFLKNAKNENRVFPGRKRKRANSSAESLQQPCQVVEVDASELSIPSPYVNKLRKRPKSQILKPASASEQLSSNHSTLPNSSEPTQTRRRGRPPSKRGPNASTNARSHSSKQ
jgi:hypothetical protein